MSRGCAPLITTCFPPRQGYPSINVHKPFSNQSVCRGHGTLHSGALSAWEMVWLQRLLCGCSQRNWPCLEGLPGREASQPFPCALVGPSPWLPGWAETPPSLPSRGGKRLRCVGLEGSPGRRAVSDREAGGARTHPGGRGRNAQAPDAMAGLSSLWPLRALSSVFK